MGGDEAVDAAIDLETVSPSQVDAGHNNGCCSSSRSWRARQVSANWPAYRLTWRHRVSGATSSVCTLLAHLEQECPSAAALGADWAHGRALAPARASERERSPLLLLGCSQRAVPGGAPPPRCRRPTRAAAARGAAAVQAAARVPAGAGALAAVARAPRPQARLLFRRSRREV